MIYKFLYIASLSLLLLDIQVWAQIPLTINANINGIHGEMVYLKKFGNDNRLILVDSTVAVDGQFTFERQSSEPDLYNIYITDVPGSIQLVWDNNITIISEKDSIWTSTITGSSTTKEWSAYQKRDVDPLRMQLIILSQKMNEAMEAEDSVTLQEISLRQQNILEHSRNKALNYIEDKPTSFISLYLLTHSAGQYGYSKTKKLLEPLTPYWKQHTKYKYLKKWTEDKRNVREGDMAPAFSTVNFEGEPVSLSSFKGKFVVLDFWGTWCGPCIAVIPELKELFQKYQPHNVELISVACELGKDEDKMLSKAKNFVQQKGMNWIHLFENKNNNDSELSLIRKYSVDVYPSTILIDPEGKIIFRGEGKSGVRQMLEVLNEKLPS